MAKKLYTESDIQNIASAIRARNGSSTTYRVSQMASAIRSMSTKPVLPKNIKFSQIVGGGFDDLYDFLCSVNLQEMASRTNFSEMFKDCTYLTAVPLFNTGSATDMSYMFNNCLNLASVPSFNTANVTNVNYMFAGCQYALETVPAFNLSKVTNCSGMFRTCTNLTSVPAFNLSKAVYCSNMFEDCESLTTAPAFTFGSLDNCAYMFNDCTALTSVSLFDTSTCTDVGAMFNGCSALVTIPQFDYRNVTSFGAVLSSTKMYDGCTSLSNASLNNILASMAGATSFSGGLLTPKTLKFLGLTQAQATICEGLSNFAAFTAAGWSTGY